MNCRRSPNLACLEVWKSIGCSTKGIMGSGRDIEEGELPPRLRQNSKAVSWSGASEITGSWSRHSSMQRLSLDIGAPFFCTNCIIDETDDGREYDSGYVGQNMEVGRISDMLDGKGLVLFKP